MKTLVTITALAASILALAPAAARARTATTGFGPRVGYTRDVSLDQIHFGGQAWIADLFGNTIVILPSVEFGLGAGATLLAINGDVVYEFTEFAQNDWSFYAGAGLALNRYDSEASGGTEFGLNALGGATRKLPGNKVAFGELRLGIEDSPDVKLTFGLTFF
jgi:hypothetical protein